MSQVIEGTDDAVEGLDRAVVAAPYPDALAPPPDVAAPPRSEIPVRRVGGSAAATASVTPSALRLPAAIEGRHVRVALGAGVGWGRRSSSLIALPHGMEPAVCIATLSTHRAPCDAPQLATACSGVSIDTSCAGGPAATDAGRPFPEGVALAATALLFLICRSGKALRFQARL